DLPDHQRVWSVLAPVAGDESADSAVDGSDDRGVREVARPQHVGVAGVDVQHLRVARDLPHACAVGDARFAEFDDRITRAAGASGAPAGGGRVVGDGMTGYF